MLDSLLLRNQVPIPLASKQQRNIHTILLFINCPKGTVSRDFFYPFLLSTNNSIVTGKLAQGGFKYFLNCVKIFYRKGNTSTDLTGPHLLYLLYSRSLLGEENTPPPLPPFNLGIYRGKLIDGLTDYLFCMPRVTL